MSWQISFFETNRGDKPVELFIRSQEVKTRAKIVRTVELLEQYGPILPMPYSKNLDHKLYELRIRGKVEIRIFYTYRNKEIYLLHAFQKKTQIIPAQELKTATDRMKLIQ